MTKSFFIVKECNRLDSVASLLLFCHDPIIGGLVSIPAFFELDKMDILATSKNLNYTW